MAFIRALFAAFLVFCMGMLIMGGVPAHAFNLTFVDVTDTAGEPRTCIFRLDGQIVVVEEQSSTRVGNISIYVDDIYPVRSQAQDSDQCEYMVSVLTPYDPGKPQPALKASDTTSGTSTNNSSSSNESQYYQGERIVLLTPQEYQVFKATLESEIANFSNASQESENLSFPVATSNSSNTSSVLSDAAVLESDALDNASLEFDWGNVSSAESSQDSAPLVSQLLSWFSSLFS